MGICPLRAEYHRSSADRLGAIRSVLDTERRDYSTSLQIEFEVHFLIMIAIIKRAKLSSLKINASPTSLNNQCTQELKGVVLGRDLCWD